MQISGSIFAVSNNWFNYARLLKNSKVDYLHIDLFDNSNINLSLKDLKLFDKTYLPLDIHLIYSYISKDDIEELNQAATHYLNIQYETLVNKEQIRWISKAFHGSFGIAITTATNIEVLDKYIDDLSQVLIMCSEPGVSGATFDESNFDRIRFIRAKYPNLPIFADGGINDIIAEQMNKLGVKMIVSGSYLAKYPEEIAHNVYSLKYANERDIPVIRTMIPYSQLPIITKDASFMEIIDIMTSYRLGIAFIVDKRRLLGIITDGDIRRAYLYFKEKLFTEKAVKFMNHHPVTAQYDWMVEDVFQLVASKQYKGVYVVPVLEKEVFIGALDLHIN